MPPNKRARAYAHRRQEKWDLRQQQRAAALRRRRLVAAAIVGSLVVATAASAVVLANRQDPMAGTPDVAAYDAPPPPSEAQGRAWTATVALSTGDVTLELDGAAAPQAVASFLMLARDGFFDGTSCHRLVTGSLIQCGDPTGTGYGGPGYSFGPIENAPEDMTYPAGTLAMARGGDAASQGSQFFIVLTETFLPNDSAGGYSVFGRVTEGLDTLLAGTADGTVDGGPDGQPATPVTIEGVVIS